MYVGQTIDFRKRWNCHRCDLTNKVHSNQILTNAWHKYGEAAFSFEVLERCSVEMLDEREQHWLDLAYHTSGQLVYNLSPISKRGYLTEEGRRRKSEAMKGNTHTLGRVRSERERLGTKLGNTGKKRSPEAIANYRRAAQKREDENRRLSQAIAVVAPWIRPDA
jgi:group I intron endonuclease